METGPSSAFIEPEMGAEFLGMDRHLVGLAGPSGSCFLCSIQSLLEGVIFETLRLVDGTLSLLFPECTALTDPAPAVGRTVAVLVRTVADAAVVDPFSFQVTK